MQFGLVDKAYVGLQTLTCVLKWLNRGRPIAEGLSIDRQMHNSL